MIRAAAVALVIAAAAVGLGALAGGPVVATVPVLAWLGGLAVAVQWVAFVPAWWTRSERFYDLTGTLTYLLVTGLAVASVGPRLDLRGGLAAAAVAVWAVRLGAFLVARIRRTGKDGRFDAIKQDAGRFLLAWTVQGLWVVLTALAALIVVTSPGPQTLLATDVVGALVWAAGWTVEVVADQQKARWSQDPAHHGRWIDVGLWAWSRHPNYFGEIVLWTGMAIVGSGVFHGTQWVGWLSPVFVTVLLTRISGVPLLEHRADARWGDDPAYRAYKARTPVLVPWPRGR